MFQKSLRLNRLCLKAAFVVAASVGALAAKDAQALVYGTVTATFQGVKPGQNVSVTYNNGGAPATVNTTAGMFEWQLTGSGFVPDPVNGVLLGLSPFSSKFYTNCIEIGEHVNPGATYTFTIVDLTQAPNVGKGTGGMNGNSNMTAVQANYLRELYGQFLGEVNPSLNTAAEKEDAAALQLAIWETVFEDALRIGSVIDQPGPSDKSFATGASNTLAKANAWLADILANNRPLAPVFALTNSNINGSRTVQDQIVLIEGGGGGSGGVPEPATIVVWLMLGLAAVGSRRFRRA